MNQHDFNKDVPIVGIDKQEWAFLDAQGNRYFEIQNDLFVVDGMVNENTIGFSGTNSHGGYVVLKPFYIFKNGKWTLLINFD